ncbi:MAG TPA: S8 family serine peptidase [Blastocatellia bacterium]|nr:S8 family serine peptidase [Blastocatellia bacterium]
MRVGLPFVPGRILVKFRSELMELGGRSVIEETGGRDMGEILGIGVHIIELPDGVDEDVFARFLKSRPDVEFAELDRVIPPAQIAPNDPWYPNEWHLFKIAAPNAWPTTTGSSNIIIAILDTGVDGAHPELSAKMVPGWNFYDNNSDTNDIAGHGTIVAGTATAATNNALGVASVSWGCRIMPIRISDPAGYATYSAAAKGLAWAADHGARVANISYSMSTSSTVASAASYFQSKGGVVTISSGNDGAFVSSPDNPYALTVGATNGDDVIYSWSNTGNNLDITAPGFVYTTVRGGGTSSASGTSVAAPVVAGVAALVLSANPSLTGSQAQDILKQSADDRGSAGWDSSYGWGRVNAARAVSLAAGSGGTDTAPPTVAFSYPSSGSTVSGTVSVQVAASDNVGVASVTVSVDGMLLGGDDSAPYSLPWDTTKISNGAHTLTAAAQDSAGNTANASIVVTVSNAIDATAPVISITSPTDGTTVSGNVSVVVNALDNVAVVRVELYVDGQLKATSTTAPFTTKWNTRREAKGAHRLQCKAYDAAGNAGTSSLVTVYR